MTKKYSIDELEQKLSLLKNKEDAGADMLRTLITQELNRRKNAGRPVVSGLSRTEQVRVNVANYRQRKNGDK